MSDKFVQYLTKAVDRGAMKMRPSLDKMPKSNCCLKILGIYEARQHLEPAVFSKDIVCDECENLFTVKWKFF